MTMVRGDDTDRTALQTEREARATRLDELLVKGEHLLEDARRTLAELDDALGEARPQG